MHAAQRTLGSYRSLQERLNQAREQTDKLFAIVRPDSLFERPIPERHRIVFYIGHLEAFDWNLFKPESKVRPFDQDLDELFAFGIDPVDGGLPTDQPSDWPSLEQVRRYTARTRDAVDALIDAGVSELLLNTAIEHRLMHAETLAYMLHQMPPESKIRQPQTSVAEHVPPVPE